MVTISTLTHLNILFREFFKNQSLELTTQTTANDIEEWDSLNHMELIAEIEKQFSLTFDFNEVISLENVGDLIKAIQNKK